MRLTNHIGLFSLMVLTGCSTQKAKVRAPNTVRDMNPVTRIDFQHQLTLRRQLSDQVIIIRNRKGNRVSKGDYIQASVIPKEAVYLYLGYCHEGEFELFPKTSSLRAEPGRNTWIPPGDAGLQVQESSNSEVLYLILSKDELSLASPDLTIKIASAGGSVDGDCARKGWDGPAPQTARWKPTDLRSDTAIEVVRYEFQHQGSNQSAAIRR